MKPGPSLFLALLLAAVASGAGPANPPALPDDIEGFRWARRDPETGQILMLIAGKRGSPTGDLVRIEGPVVTLFDRPSGPATGRPIIPSTTTLTGDRGAYDKAAGRLTLDGHAVVTRSDGTVVRTEALSWSVTEGRFWTEAYAEISDGSSTITGSGLEGRMTDLPDLGRTLDRITLQKDVRTVLTGAELLGLDDLFNVPAAQGPAGVTITCGGAMTYLRLASAIDYTEGVEARDARRSLSARSLSLALGPDRRITKLVATGGVRARGAQQEEAAGETFSWEAGSARALLSGAPYIRVQRPGGSIRAAGMVHDRALGRTRFDGPGVIDLPPSVASP